jgi:hypothetical protein
MVSAGVACVVMIARRDAGTNDSTALPGSVGVSVVGVRVYHAITMSMGDAVDL